MLDLSTFSPLTAGVLSETGESDEANALTNVLHLGTRLKTLAGRADRREAILEALLTVLGGERSFLVQWSEDDQSWTVESARTFDGEEILNPSDKIIHDLLTPCRERGEGYFTADLAEEAVAEALQRARQPRTRSLLILPFPSSDQLVYIDHRFQPLELRNEHALELTWLFTVLVKTEEAARSKAQKTELQEDLRAARRKLKERKKVAPRATEAEPREPITGSGEVRGLRGDFSSIVGHSAEIMEILHLLDRVAPTAAPVLINGESGTGKELIANAIHENSPRRDAAIVSENCGALTETLLESELFGYVKGAFTGAYEDREGLFEVADGGTLFLDEIGDTSPGMQKKLLRVLQEGQIRRVGGAELIPVDVRVISATNKDLMSEVRAGRFREDLFYRLNVINVILPPLRDRLEDLPLLADTFVRRLNADAPSPKTLPPEMLTLLTQHTWPGNIRELQNEIRRVFTLSEDRLSPELLSPRVLERDAGPDSGAVLDLDRVLEIGSLRGATEELEKQILTASLRRFHGNKASVCSHLGIPKTTLYSKLKKLGLE